MLVSQLVRSRRSEGSSTTDEAPCGIEVLICCRLKHMVGGGTYDIWNLEVVPEPKLCNST
jgi:hypothetical protein